MKLELTARGKGTREAYEPLEEYALRARTEESSGEAVIRLAADEDFEGVVMIALSVPDVGSASDRFFLPGFLYGTNRGDAPPAADNNTPRMRLRQDFPASPRWMVRSDRLPHPCALIYRNGRITGLAVSPC